MSTHGLFIVHRTQPGRRDDVRAVWNEHMAPAIDANDDHLAYIYSFDQADEDVIRVFQLYASAEAAAAFLETESYERYLAAVEGLLSGPPELYAVTPEWSKNVGGPG
ncbi:MAG TPA: antibiotic biosynthesis monooxygenase [Acidimicrobiales bacterium]